MPQRYVVGFRIGGRYRHVQVDGEDALDAAQQVKDAHPDAHVTYSRKHNSRADERHPEPMLGEERMADAGSKAPRTRRAASKIPKVSARGQDSGARNQGPGGGRRQERGVRTPGVKRQDPGGTGR
jgi:hypothetical protein